MFSSEQLITLIAATRTERLTFRVFYVDDKLVPPEHRNSELKELLDGGLFSKKLVVEDPLCRPVWELRLTDKGKRFLDSCSMCDFARAFAETGRLQQAVMYITELGVGELSEFLVHSNALVRSIARKRMSKLKLLEEVFNESRSTSTF